jgi:hypothetical protein
LGLRLDELASGVTLTVRLQEGVLVVSKPLKVCGPVIEWLIVDMVDVIAATSPSLRTRARRQKCVSYQLMHLDAANLAFTLKCDVLIAPSTLQLQHPAVEAVCFLAIPSEARDAPHPALI